MPSFLMALQARGLLFRHLFQHWSNQAWMEKAAAYRFWTSNHFAFHTIDSDLLTWLAVSSF
jgi:hypothetical protein